MKGNSKILIVQTFMLVPGGGQPSINQTPADGDMFVKEGVLFFSHSQHDRLYPNMLGIGLKTRGVIVEEPMHMAPRAATQRVICSVGGRQVAEYFIRGEIYDCRNLPGDEYQWFECATGTRQIRVYGAIDLMTETV